MSSVMEETFQKKRRRIDIHKIERKSSLESFDSQSNYVSSESEELSESEFEDHPYSARRKNNTKMEEFQFTSISHGSNDKKSKFQSDLKVTKRSKYISKNAINARMNRLKKKKYIEDLERRNAELEVENEMLKNMLVTRIEEAATLKRETVNLRNVIRNGTEIGSLLKCIHQNTNLKISSSLLKNMSQDSQANSSDRPIHSFPATTNNVSSPGSEEEGNGFMHSSPRNNPTLSPASLSHSDVIDNVNFDVDLSYLLPTTLENDIKPSQFELTETMVLNKFDPEVFSSDNILRCDTPSKMLDTDTSKDCLFDDVGICFHIANNKVSLEFCDSCNRNAL